MGDSVSDSVRDRRRPGRQQSLRRGRIVSVSYTHLILDAHGEDIAVTSRDGETEFVFTLTLAKPAPKPRCV